MKIKYIITTLFCFLYISSIYSQTDSSEVKGLKKYWNSLIHGNVDRTFEKNWM